MAIYCRRSRSSPRTTRRCTAHEIRFLFSIVWTTLTRRTAGEGFYGHIHSHVAVARWCSGQTAYWTRHSNGARPMGPLDGSGSRSKEKKPADGRHQARFRISPGLPKTLRDFRSQERSNTPQQRSGTLGCKGAVPLPQTPVLAITFGTLMSEPYSQASWSTGLPCPRPN